MTHTDLEWTHKQVSIKDIRKLNKLYVIKINVTDNDKGTQIDSPLFIKDIIFEERIESYFFKDIKLISRNDILNVKWNMYITKGFYIKILYNENKDEIVKNNGDINKWYVSYLDIDGPLSSSLSLYKNKEN
ncbi:hypothetical protein M0Q50_09750 [bacterium]|jgi:hypothetical protein|nr:hypothetical protein [bacterium]